MNQNDPFGTQGLYDHEPDDRPLSPEINGYRLDVNGARAGHVDVDSSDQQVWTWSFDAPPWPDQFSLVPEDTEISMAGVVERLTNAPFDTGSPTAWRELVGSPRAQLFRFEYVNGITQRAVRTEYVVRSVDDKGYSSALQWTLEKLQPGPHTGVVADSASYVRVTRVPDGQQVRVLGWIPRLRG